MITRTQVTLSVYGTNFKPSKVDAPFSKAHDPGVIGKVGRYLGVPVPYGSADFEAPEEYQEKIIYVYQAAFPFLSELRSAGAESLSLHITYHHENQCAIGFSQEELKMISGLQCDVAIDCMKATEVEKGTVAM